MNSKTISAQGAKFLSLCTTGDVRFARCALQVTHVKLRDVATVSFLVLNIAPVSGLHAWSLVLTTSTTICSHPCQTTLPKIFCAKEFSWWICVANRRSSQPAEPAALRSLPQEAKPHGEEKPHGVVFGRQGPLQWQWLPSLSPTQ